jgi:predicted lipoprotein with Yx(FWY)xxD motif
VAHAIGDFSVVDYEPGIRQWAFKGGSLYSYVQDREAGDVKGRAVDPAMEVAFVARDFLPAEAALAANHFGGVSLVSAAGMTLYARDSSGVGSGQNLRVGAHGVPAIGRSLGASACDAECAKTWPPLAAPSDAIACGYWAPIRREDGAPQWSYDGYALYTYSGDRAPGDTNGFGIFRYAEVGEKPKIESTGGVHIAGVPPSSGLTQIHWRMAVP